MYASSPPRARFNAEAACVVEAAATSALDRLAARIGQHAIRAPGSHQAIVCTTKARHLDIAARLFAYAHRRRARVDSVRIDGADALALRVLPGSPASTISTHLVTRALTLPKHTDVVYFVDVDEYDDFARDLAALSQRPGTSFVFIEKNEDDDD